MPRSGAHVVMIKADLLHFHPVPSALESSVGGVVLTGSRAAAHASTKNATTSMALFIAVNPVFIQVLISAGAASGV